MPGFSGFAVDLDALSDTVDELTRRGDGLDVLLDEVAARVAALHLTWAGEAATAQRAAQAEWEAGFRDLREALAAMRAAADLAHGAYGEAATTNVRMWEQLR